MAAGQVAAEIARAGVTTDTLEAATVSDIGRYDGVVVVGGTWLRRFRRDVTRFVRTYAADLRGRLVWFASVEDDARPCRPRRAAVPYGHVRSLMAAVDAHGYACLPAALADDDRDEASQDRPAPDRHVRTWSKGVAAHAMFHAPRRGTGWLYDGRSTVETMDAANCLALIGSEGLGRLAALAGTRPVSLPVSYHVGADGNFVLAVPDAAELLANHVRPVSLEINGVEASSEATWNVVVVGRLEHAPGADAVLVVTNVTGRRTTSREPAPRFGAGRGTRDLLLGEPRRSIVTRTT